MHLEILVEGQTERTALSIILPKMLGPYASPHTWTIHKHRGLGELPDDPTARPDPRNHTLLHTLPASLRAYGQSLRDDQAVLVLADLDDRDCHRFKEQLVGLLAHCRPAPRCVFRIAIEELEAWFLGDRAALLAAYPHASPAVLGAYVQDSICGTWEVLAEAVHRGGAKGLKASRHRSAPVAAKRVWAKEIAPHMDMERNASTSFRVFREAVLRLCAPPHP